MFPETGAQVFTMEISVWLHYVEHNIELKFNFREPHTASKCDTSSIFEDYSASEVQKS